MKYSEKLKHPKWQKKRLEILSRDGFKCTLCEDEETELQIHHLAYNGEPWEAEDEHLETLCKSCHVLKEAVKKINREVVSAKKFETVCTGDFIIYKCIDGTAGAVMIDRDKIQNSISFKKGSPALKMLYEYSFEL